MNSETETPKTVAATPLSALEKVLLTVGSAIRWKMLRELAGGETRTIAEMASVGQCSYDSAVKHLRFMRDAGVLVQGRGSLYQLPPQFLAGPNAVDFGHCLLRFDKGK